MGPLRNYFNQTRKPEGTLGKLMLSGMNSGHAKLADWGISRLPDLSPARIADLGCGGGRNLSTLLQRYAAAQAEGVDYSPLSVKKALAYNEAAVKNGRCRVYEGDVSALPLADGFYDLATAFETVYFWPGLKQCFAEVRRILKPGGIFLIVNESDGTDLTGKKFEKIIDGMRIYTGGELTTALKTAGFTPVEICRHGKKPWMAIVSRKEES